MKYIAYCIKGVENILEDELRIKIQELRILENGTKRIVFDTDADIKKILFLRTADDVGFLANEFVVQKIDPIEEITDRILDTDLVDLQCKIEELRAVKNNSFSLTVGVVGNDYIDAEILKETLSEKVKDTYRWGYLEEDHTQFDIRVFIDKTQVYVSVRLTEKPLFWRDYKINSYKGALRPSIAAAMVFKSLLHCHIVANRACKEGSRWEPLNQLLRVVDNTCGSGTILCEALGLGLEVYGGDIDAGAVMISQASLESLGYVGADRIKKLDCTKSGWPDNNFDIAVSNLPYGKIIKVEKKSDFYKKTLAEYMRIVKPGGIICLLLPDSEVLNKVLKNSTQIKDVKRARLGFLGQTPEMLTVIKS